jgi:hypothetical protein
MGAGIAKTASCSLSVLIAMSPLGTKRTSPVGLTMSVIEGKADLPVEHPDF